MDEVFDGFMDLFSKEGIGLLLGIVVVLGGLAVFANVTPAGLISSVKNAVMPGSTTTANG